MSLHTTAVVSGPLADVDLVALGARTGALWRSPQVTLAGMGPTDPVSVDLASAASSLAEDLAARAGVDEVSAPGTGPIGMAALPFDAARRGGVVQVPSIVVGESAGTRFVTRPAGMELREVEAMVLDTLDAPLGNMPSVVDVTLARSATEWRDQVVAACRDELASSGARKAVMARELVLHADRPFPADRVALDVADRFPTANVFSIDGFLGASPELLVSRFGRTVRAHPLAGTAARHPDPDIDRQVIDTLRASTKDRTEHQITIDWLLTELLPFCSYVDAEPEPSVVSLANVHHLGTLVDGVLSAPAASILDLVTAVHPTPAVGGDPQGAALELIGRLEGFDRGRYAGPSGWVDAAGNGEFAVSVRTAQLDGSQATVWAGVGVVAQSDPQAELEETQAKFGAMLGTLLGR